MARVIFGIDPDSEAHGVAVYVDGKLERLESKNLMELMALVISYVINENDVVIHIEDVNGVSAAFGARDNNHNIHVKLKMAQHIGMCKQSQIEIERFLAAHGIPCVKHKISKIWKKDKAQFEKITGWTGRSNEDTRSSAYFGFLGLSPIKTTKG